MIPEFLANVPIEDEELTPETIAALKRASSSIERGETISHEEILREFDLYCLEEQDDRTRR